MKSCTLNGKLYRLSLTRKLLVRWECVVLDLGADSFWCRLVDVSGKQPDYEAEIEYTKFPKKPVLGEFFFWNVVQDDKFGRNEFELPTPVLVTKEEIEEARKRAEETAKLLDWDKQ